MGCCASQPESTAAKTGGQQLQELMTFEAQQNNKEATVAKEADLLAAQSVETKKEGAKATLQKECAQEQEKQTNSKIPQEATPEGEHNALAPSTEANDKCIENESKILSLEPKLDTGTEKKDRLAKIVQPLLPQRDLALYPGDAILPAAAAYREEMLTNFQINGVSQVCLDRLCAKHLGVEDLHGVWQGMTAGPRANRLFQHLFEDVSAGSDKDQLLLFRCLQDRFGNA